MRTSMKRPPEPLTADQAEKLIASCSRKSSRGARNAAMLAVMYRCGLRSQELCDLELRDFEPENGILHVRHGKGDQARVVGIDEGSIELVNRWISFRGDEPGLLFVTNRLNAICPSYIRRFMRGLGKKLKIPRR